MRTISEGLRAERPDYTLPASFYRPGAKGWDDRRAVNPWQGQQLEVPASGMFSVADPED